MNIQTEHLVHLEVPVHVLHHLHTFHSTVSVMVVFFFFSVTVAPPLVMMILASYIRYAECGAWHFKSSDDYSLSPKHTE